MSRLLNTMYLGDDDVIFFKLLMAVLMSKGMDNPKKYFGTALALIILVLFWVSFGPVPIIGICLALIGVYLKHLRNRLYLAFVCIGELCTFYGFYTTYQRIPSNSVIFLGVGVFILITVLVLIEPGPMEEPQKISDGPTPEIFIRNNKKFYGIFYDNYDGQCGIHTDTVFHCGDIITRQRNHAKYRVLNTMTAITLIVFIGNE